MMGILDCGVHRQRQEFAAKLVKPLPGLGAYGENSGMASLKKRALEECFYLQADLLETARADGVNLGDHGKAAADAKQAADGKMLLGLRLDAFFGGDNQQDGINAACACEHVADEEFMPWDIDEADAQRAIVSCRCIERSES